MTSEFTSKWINLRKTQSNFTLISIITFEVLAQTLLTFQGSRRNSCRWCLQNYIKIGCELTEILAKTGKNDDKNAQRSVKTHCRKWVWGYCDCLGISFIFRLTTFDVRIRRQKPSNGENRVFHFSLNKGYVGKTIFSSSFSARYHIL